MSAGSCCKVGTHINCGGIVYHMQGDCGGIVYHMQGDWGGGITDFLECNKCRYDGYPRWEIEEKTSQRPKWIIWRKRKEYGRDCCWFVLHG